MGGYDYESEESLADQLNQNEITKQVAAEERELLAEISRLVAENDRLSVAVMVAESKVAELQELIDATPKPCAGDRECAGQIMLYAMPFSTASGSYVLDEKEASQIIAAYRTERERLLVEALSHGVGIVEAYVVNPTEKNLDLREWKCAARQLLAERSSADAQTEGGV